MVKFYSCFPISVDGNQLSISMAPENMNVKDEEAVFTTLIKESDPEVSFTLSAFVYLSLIDKNISCLFVHLLEIKGNLSTNFRILR